MLTQLPSELVEHIISYLGLDSLRACAISSKYLRAQVAALKLVPDLLARGPLDWSYSRLGHLSCFPALQAASIYLKADEGNWRTLLGLRQLTMVTIWTDDEMIALKCADCLAHLPQLKVLRLRIGRSCVITIIVGDRVVTRALGHPLHEAVLDRASHYAPMLEIEAESAVPCWGLMISHCFTVVEVGERVSLDDVIPALASRPQLTLNMSKASVFQLRRLGRVPRAVPDWCGTLIVPAKLDQRGFDEITRTLKGVTVKRAS